MPIRRKPKYIVPPDYTAVRVGPNPTLTAEERRRIDQLRVDVRRHLSELDIGGAIEADALNDPQGRIALAKSTLDLLRRGEPVGVADLATACRALAWDVGAFYDALGLDDGDYSGLIRLNDNIYFDARPGDWDS